MIVKPFFIVSESRKDKRNTVMYPRLKIILNWEKRLLATKVCVNIVVYWLAVVIRPWLLGPGY